jgi:hypothetical protein
VAYQYSRADLRGRLRVEAKLKAVTDPYDDGTLNRTLQYALAHTWEWLSSTDQGFGVRSQTKTVAAEPDGWIPGATSVVLPSDFRRLVELRRGNSFPDLVSPSESTWRQGPWYIINGPGQTVDSITAALVPTPQTIEFSPALSAGEEIRLVYAQQPPSLGSPDDPLLDGTSLDLVGDWVETRGSMSGGTAGRHQPGPRRRRRRPPGDLQGRGPQHREGGRGRLRARPRRVPARPVGVHAHGQPAQRRHPAPLPIQEAPRSDPVSSNQSQKKIERAPERVEPEADLLATWCPPVPTRWSAGYDYALEVPEAVQRAARGIDVYAVVFVVGRGRAEWAVLDEDGKVVRTRLAGIDMHQLVVRLHAMPACLTGGTPRG